MYVICEDTFLAYVISIDLKRKRLVDRQAGKQTVQDWRDIGCKWRYVDIDFNAVCIVECASYICRIDARVRERRLHRTVVVCRYTVTRGIDERVCKITDCPPRQYRPRDIRARCIDYNRVWIVILQTIKASINNLHLAPSRCVCIYTRKECFCSSKK